MGNVMAGVAPGAFLDKEYAGSPPGALPTYTWRFTEPLNNAAQDGYKPFATSPMLASGKFTARGFRGP
jgi:hypothetical protein